MAFMIAQRAFIKVYLITMVEQHKGYGYQMLEDLRRDFKAHGYSPPQSEIYRALHELVQQGILYRTKQLKGERSEGRFSGDCPVSLHFGRGGEGQTI